MLIKYFNTVSSTRKNWLVLFFSSLFSQVLPVITYPIVTRIYTPAQIGVWSVFMSISSILVIIATGRYENAIILPKDDLKAKHLSILTFFILMIVCLIIFILFVSFNTYFATVLKTPELDVWLPWLALSVLFLGLYQIINQLNIRFCLFKNNAIYNFHNSSVNTILKLVFGFLGLKTGGLLLSTLVSQITSGVHHSALLLKTKKIFFEKVSLINLRNVALEFSEFPKYQLSHALINTLSLQIPVLFITSYFGTNSAGLYALAFGLAFRPIQIIAYSTTQISSQQMAEKINLGISIKQDFINQLKKLFFFSLLPFIFIGISAPYIFPYVFGEEWALSGIYLRYLTPWLYLILLCSPFSFIPSLYKKQKIALYLELVYFTLRMLSLFLGLYYDNFNLLLILFSVSGFTYLSFSLIWYYRLLKN